MTNQLFIYKNILADTRNCVGLRVFFFFLSNLISAPSTSDRLELQLSKIVRLGTSLIEHHGAETMIF